MRICLAEPAPHITVIEPLDPDTRYHTYFKDLAGRYPGSSLWTLERLGTRVIPWSNVVLAAMLTGFHTDGATPDGTPESRELFWRVVYEKLEELSESMVSSEEVILR